MGDEPLVGDHKNLLDEETFPAMCGEGGMSKFLFNGGTPPHPPVTKILFISTMQTHSKGHGFKPNAFLESHKSFAKCQGIF